MGAGALTAAELEEALGHRIARLEHRPSAYRTSFPIEEVDLELDDGAVIHLVFKDLGWDALTAEARRAKPEFLHDPLREIETYRGVLEPVALGTARFYGAAVDPGRERYWLFVERLPSVDLTQIGELEVWKGAARWLAGLHDRCREARTPHLLVYDESHYRLWLDRALQFAPSPELDRIAARYDEVVGRLLALPAGFIHGELYASNVLVDGERVCPIDWEMSAVGPCLVDLAALTAGKWGESERAEIALAYRSALAEPPSTEAFLEDLERCRLQLALQWLGWSPDWTPPPERHQDWLGEAVRAAERLRL